MKLTMSHAQYNLTSEELINIALRNNEGVLSASGALCVTTGKRTGRSPKDRFIVEDAITKTSVHWGKINQPMDPKDFNKLWLKAENYIRDRTVYVSHLHVGAEQKFTLPVEVVTELAWQNLFARVLFIAEKPGHSEAPGWTILSTPGLKTDPSVDPTNSDAVIAINFTERKILLIGMLYAGEIKKGMFTVMNFLLPEHGVLPMHCAANKGKEGDVALFFGLSGTGKTTLSADPERLLIGDDEHGWGKDVVFNFEGGCYAKCVALSHEREPIIWDAIKHGAIMENVVLKKNGDPDYMDTSLTENTRAAYPREHIAKRVIENHGAEPKSVIFLTCDLYGVLPPVALLTKEQASYYFLSGYTALVGSTEVGSAPGVAPTFSTCFGAPFFPRPPVVYADLLMQRIEESGALVYLVNTGWTGGAYGKGGKRFAIPTTRAVVTAIVSGSLRNQPTDNLPGFNFAIPRQVKGVEEKILNPRNTWQDQAAYNECANELAEKFQKNFERFEVSERIRSAGPQKV